MGIIIDKRASGVRTPNTQNIMLVVMLALLPGTLVYAVFISPLVLFNIALAVLAAVSLEQLALYLRGERGIHTVKDGSIALAAFLLALAVPPALPFWQLLVGVLIMVMLGKQVFGGIGHNPFNPAMVGYAALLVSFPQSMTLWFAVTDGSSLSIMTLLKAKLSLNVISATPQIAWDGLTQATPLEHARGFRLQSLPQVKNELNERVFASGWIPTNIGFLFGGLYLLHRKLIHWYIPVSVLAGYVLLSLLFSNQGISLPWSVFSGALILGAFFIATDPVTAASSRRGQLVFGAGVGILVFVIREYGGYPEGLAFAVLLMNLSVPLIDHIDMLLGQRS